MSVTQPAPAPSPVVDGVLMAVLTKRLESIAAKMHNTLLRTARSGVINNGRDFSCCILTGDAQLLAVGESLPIHVMVGADMMSRSMMEFHPELERGDAYLHNSPYHGCSHAADLSVLVPVIDEAGVHRFTVLAKAHQADIGNAVPTTYHAAARDVYEEGALIFPAVKVQESYRDIDDIVRMCMLRIRVPEQWRGDYLAGVGAARIGERELLGLGTEYGWETLEDYIRSWFDYSEQRMEAAIRRLPGGRVSAVSVHDPFPGTPPEGVVIRSSVTVDAEGGRIEVDLRDNPDEMPSGLNVSEACTRTAAMVGIFNSLDQSVPPNAGSFRRITIHVRDGCVVGVPSHPTSCSVATTNVADRILNATQLALSELGEGFGMAEAGPVQSLAVAVISGHDPRRGGAAFVNQLLLGDTLGPASPHEDAWLSIMHIGAAGLCFWDSIEVDELAHPIRVHERRIEPDGEGPGRFCGAPPSRVEFGPIGCSLQAVGACDGRINRAQGARGGLPGVPTHNYHRTRDGELAELGGWCDLMVEDGESVIGICAGGAGYGSPLERDPKRVERDVGEGLVSVERAREVYGVVFTADGEIDAEATAARRGAHDSSP